MNQNILEGKWMQLRGAVREKWGELTDDELDQIAGKRDRLAGVLQERYGYTRSMISSIIGTRTIASSCAPSARNTFQRGAYSPLKFQVNI
jgi:uncharacterized protein YjbJ (UPF0337 family)